MAIPHDLVRSMPRDVRLSPAGRVVATVALAAGVAAVGLSAWLYLLAARGRAADAGAAAVAGEVVRLAATRDEHPRWVATYSYEAAGRRYENTSRLGRRDRQPLAVGDTLRVRYLPDDPGTSWVEGYQPGRVPIFVAPAVFLGLAVAAGSLAGLIRYQKWMLAFGRPAAGTVTASTSVAQSHGKTTRITVQYRILSGATVETRFDLAKAPKVGAEVLLLYDPETPTRAVRYPLSLVSLALPA